MGWERLTGLTAGTVIVPSLSSSSYSTCWVIRSGVGSGAVLGVTGGAWGSAGGEAGAEGGAGAEAGGEAEGLGGGVALGALGSPLPSAKRAGKTSVGAPGSVE